MRPLAAGIAVVVVVRVIERFMARSEVAPAKGVDSLGLEWATPKVKDSD